MSLISKYVYLSFFMCPYGQYGDKDKSIIRNVKCKGCSTYPLELLTYHPTVSTCKTELRM